jgi:hypothetical protein
VTYSKRIKIIKNTISNGYIVQPFLNSATPCVINRYIALKNYLPNNATSHIFGTTSGEYSGNFEDKVRKLAKNLKYKVKAEATSFQKNNTLFLTAILSSHS